MNIKEQIRAEIKRRIHLLRSSIMSQGDYGQSCHIVAYENILAFLDTLPEQPASGELEDEIVNYYGNIPDDNDKVKAARHFAEWMKAKMMEGAVEANLLSVEGDSYGIVSYTFQGRRFPAAFSGECFSYKIIVIKDEK